MSVPSRNVKKIVIYKGTVMISSSWVLMRARDLKVKSDGNEKWAGYNLGVTHLSDIIKKEIHRAKWNANKRKDDQDKIQPQQP